MTRGRRRARALLIVIVTVVVAGAVAMAATGSGRPPEERASTRLALSGIDLYGAVVRPVMHLAGIRCRMRPTCSAYAREAITRRGVVEGGWLTLRRIVRCGPWTPAGTVDRLPPRPVLHRPEDTRKLLQGGPCGSPDSSAATSS